MTSPSPTPGSQFLGLDYLCHCMRITGKDFTGFTSHKDPCMTIDITGSGNTKVCDGVRVPLLVKPLHLWDEECCLAWGVEEWGTAARLGHSPGGRFASCRVRWGTGWQRTTRKFCFFILHYFILFFWSQERKQLKVTPPKKMCRRKSPFVTTPPKKEWAIERLILIRELSWGPGMTHVSPTLRHLIQGSCCRKSLYPLHLLLFPIHLYILWVNFQSNYMNNLPMCCWKHITIPPTRESVFGTWGYVSQAQQDLIQGSSCGELSSPPLPLFCSLLYLLQNDLDLCITSTAISHSGVKLWRVIIPSPPLVLHPSVPPAKFPGCFHNREAPSVYFIKV